MDLLQQSDQQINRTTVFSAGYRQQIRTASGVSYFEYAGRAGGTSGGHDSRCQKIISVTARPATR